MLEIQRTRLKSSTIYLNFCLWHVSIVLVKISRNVVCFTKSKFLLVFFKKENLWMITRWHLDSWLLSLDASVASNRTHTDEVPLKKKKLSRVHTQFVYVIAFYKFETDQKPKVLFLFSFCHVFFPLCKLLMKSMKYYSFLCSIKWNSVATDFIFNRLTKQSVWILLS